MFTVRRMNWAALAVLGLSLTTAFAGTASKQDFADLKKEVEDLRQRLAARNVPAPSGAIARADTLVENKYGPNAMVTTKDGKLTLGGLLQFWAYSIENDNKDYVADGQSTNELVDNDGYRVRRAELKFSLDITPEITAVVMIDPTGGDEANTFPGVPTNQTVVGKGFLAGGSSITMEQLTDYWRQWWLEVWWDYLEGEERDPDLGFGFVARKNMQAGSVLSNRLLQDAYINYHSSHIPHHDFTIGQFKPPMGEEGNRSSGQLDFVERAMINQFSNQRDLGIMVHGWWWDERFQYWIGAFDTAGTFHNTFASLQNRSDDNDAKDLAWKIMLRPLWRDEKWGSLEIGYSRQDGVHGESGTGYNVVLIVPPGGVPPWYWDIAAVPTVDGLSLQETHANRQYAWAWYRPGGPVRGWWLRGEWASMSDRSLPGLGATNFYGVQMSPAPYRREGWYMATGYRLADSIWADDLKNGNWFQKALHDMEFAYRYETFGNLIVEDAVYVTEFELEQENGGYRYVLPKARRTDVFKTNVHTFGINYYWKGYNVRTQVNYMIVDESEGHAVSPGYSGGPNGKRIREVRNNVFIVSHQVMW
jgi:hypothetical protein